MRVFCASEMVVDSGMMTDSPLATQDPVAATAGIRQSFAFASFQFERNDRDPHTIRGRRSSRVFSSQTPLGKFGRSCLDADAATPPTRHPWDDDLDKDQDRSDCPQGNDAVSQIAASKPASLGATPAGEHDRDERDKKDGNGYYADVRPVRMHASHSYRDLKNDRIKDRYFTGDAGLDAGGLNRLHLDPPMRGIICSERIAAGRKTVNQRHELLKSIDQRDIVGRQEKGRRDQTRCPYGIGKTRDVYLNTETGHLLHVRKIQIG